MFKFRKLVNIFLKYKVVLIMRFPILVLIVALALSPILAQSAETYNSTVYTPNGTRYVFEIKYSEVEINTTTEEVLFVTNKTISGFLELSSKFLTAGYYGWGATIKVDTKDYENGELKSSDTFNVSIPPVLAIKEGTRKIYLTNVIIKFMRGEYEDVNEAVKDLSNIQPVEDFYVYNPFYIPTNVKAGDKIPYGFWNTTANEGMIVYGKIVKETSVNINGESYNSWVIDLISGIEELAGQLGEEEGLPEDVNATFNLYYEKTTGWLIKAEVFGESDYEESNTTTIHSKLDGLLRVDNLGGIVVGGKTYIERVTGLPSYTSLMISIAGIMGAVLIIVQRVKK